MKRRDFEIHLRRHGCLLLRHGAGHDIWINLQTSQSTSVPRHREMKFGLMRGICRQLRVPPPGR